MDMKYENDNDKKLNRNKTESSYRKVCSTEKTELLKTLIKLKQQEDVTEKMLNNFVRSMKVDSEITQNIIHDQFQLSTDRQKFMDTLKQTVYSIVSDMKLAKSVITDFHSLQEIDIKIYKERLLKLLKKIQDFKKSCSLHVLVDEQTKLESELNEFTFDVHKYDPRNDTAIKLFVPKGSSQISNNEKGYQDYHEVQDFNSLIIRTGHTQNWSESDHLFFLKMRKKCSNIPTLVNAIKNKCPDLSTECIINHEAWYKIYLDLREKQRIAVKEWRKQKELEKSKKSEINEELEGRDHDEEAANVNEENNEKKDTSAKKKNESKWKMEKENKFSVDEEQLKSKKILEKNSELVTTEMASSRCTEDVKNIRKNTSKSTSTHTIKFFRRQDKEYVTRKQNLEMRSKKDSQDQCVKKASYDHLVLRKCSTLLNSTKAWEEKCKMEVPRCT